MSKLYAIIIGAGPAGLTAAYEFVNRSDIIPVILESSGDIGGIAKTINFKGNRIDLGGHRFFSRSERVLNWWQDIMPVMDLSGLNDEEIFNHLKEENDNVFIVRNRLSRIYYSKKLFDYPLNLSLKTIFQLGIGRLILIILSYLFIKIKPITEEKNLEDFFINRFGKVLYNIFFREYTEKVWGVPCTSISPEWGIQRIKGLSIKKTIHHAIKSFFNKDKSMRQKNTQTSLIEKFIYPKFGPGQFWELVAKKIVSKNGQILLHHRVSKINLNGEQIISIEATDEQTGIVHTFKGDYFISTMPVKELLTCIGSPVPTQIQHIANGLKYRNFITVGLLLKKLKLRNKTKLRTINNIVPDNWIYIQEPGTKAGRLQIFNNWSPFMVKDPFHTTWIGVEYFCNDEDEIWQMDDHKITGFALSELVNLSMIDQSDFLDAIVLRMPKTYPAYFGTYDQFDKIREYTDRFKNLFLVGRNGMHKYNNMDHSMLTAMTAVDNILNGETGKENIWSINTEEVYHEENDKTKPA